MQKTIAIAGVGLLAALLTGTWFATRNSSDNRFADCSDSVVSGGAIGGSFELVDENGKTVTDQDVITQPSILYFGYTFCPDVCPADTARNAAAVELLEERGLIVQPVFITIDPERDTPEVVKEFTDYLHPRFLGLTGSEEQVKAASKAYRTYYKKQKPESPDDEFYLVDHSVFSYLVLPNYGFVEFFKRDTTSEEMAEKTACYINAM